MGVRITEVPLFSLKGSETRDMIVSHKWVIAWFYKSTKRSAFVHK